MDGILIRNKISRESDTQIGAGTLTPTVDLTYFAVVASDGTGDYPSSISPGWTLVDQTSSGTVTLSLYSRRSSPSLFGCTATWTASQARRAIQIWTISDLDATTPVVQTANFESAFFANDYAKATNGTFFCAVTEGDIFNYEPALTGSTLADAIAGSFQPEATFALSDAYTGASAYARRFVAADDYSLSVDGISVVAELNATQPQQDDFPSPIVEVSPTTYGTPRLDDLHWIEVTSTSMEADVSLGRSDELTGFGAGVLSLKLNEPISYSNSYLNLPAGAYTYAPTDALAEVAANDTLRIRLKLTPDSWLDECISFGNDFYYLTMVEGYPTISDGSVTPTLITSPKPVSFDNGETGWIEALVVGDDATGFVGYIFYESYDGQRWRCLGTQVDTSLAGISFVAGTLSIANNGASTTKVHNAWIGSIELPSSTDSPYTHWLLKYDVDAFGLVEHVRGLNKPSLSGGAVVSTQDASLEPGWFIRLGAHNAGDDPIALFTGRVTQATKDFSPPNTTFQELQATDVAEAISNVELSKTLYSQVVVSDSPSMFWPLNDESTTAVDLSGNNANGTYGANAMHAPGLADGIANAALSLADEGSWVRSNVVEPLSQYFGFSIEFWIKTRTSLSAGHSAPIFVYGATNVDLAVEVCLINQGLVFAIEGDGHLASRQINDGKLHHVVCTYTPDGDAYIYIDGEQVTTTTPTNQALIYFQYLPTYTNELIIGYSTNNTYHVPVKGALDDVALYGYVLTSWQVKAHYRIGIAGVDSNTLAQRVADLLEVSGFDDSYLAADGSATTTVVQTKPVYVGNLMAELDTLATSYSGRIHSNHRGRLAVYGFDYFPSPVASFSDDGVALPYQVNGFEVAIDRDLLHNKITGATADGIDVVAQDPSSIGRYGEHAYDIGTVRASSAGAVQTIAEHHLERYRVPHESFKQIVIRPQGHVALWPYMSLLTVSNVVSVSFDGDEANYIIEGTKTSIGPKFWETTLALSPKEADDFWRWGEDVLGQTTRWS